MLPRTSPSTSVDWIEIKSRELAAPTAARCGKSIPDRTGNREWGMGSSDFPIPHSPFPLENIMEKAQIGIIGGSGLYQMDGLTDVREIGVETPFGKPSDNFILGTLEGSRVAFLARHGRGHRLTPSELPFRANIYAMKLLGVERIISASAVGSLQERYAPMDIVIPDQFLDRTL